MTCSPEGASFVTNRCQGPSGSLPHADEVDGDTSWTGRMDRKVKKRIQNRVAQRTYRQRIKARIAELEAKVDLNRGNNQPRENDKPAQGPDGNCKSDAISHGAEGQSVPYPRVLRGTGFRDKGTLFTHDASSISTVPGSDLFFHYTPPFTAEKTGENIRTAKQGDMGLLPVPKQVVDKGRTQLETIELSCLDSNVAASTQTAAVAQHDAITYPFTPTTSENSDSADSFFTSRVESQNPDLAPSCAMEKWPSFDTLWSPIAHPDTANRMDTHGLIFQPGVNGEAQISTHTAKRDSLDKRFLGIMDGLDASGFETFDALVTAYYTGAFRTSSQLSNEQRLSRNRRLPAVLADIFSAARSWSVWEQRNFYEEITKSAEAILVSENAKACVLPLDISATFVGQGRTSSLPATETVQLLKAKVPDQLPNQWALMMAIAASGGPAWQKDRSNVALASVMLIHFAGRLDNEVLLDLIRVCL